MVFFFMFEGRVFRRVGAKTHYCLFRFRMIFLWEIRHAEHGALTYLFQIKHC